MIFAAAVLQLHPGRAPTGEPGRGHRPAFPASWPACSHLDDPSTPVSRARYEAISGGTRKVGQPTKVYEPTVEDIQSASRPVIPSCSPTDPW